MEQHNKSKLDVVLCAGGFLIIAAAVAILIFADSPRIRTPSYLMVSLGAAVICVRSLSSTGVFKAPGIQLGGGAAILYVLFLLLVKYAPAEAAISKGISLQLMSDGRQIADSEYVASWQYSSKGSPSKCDFKSGRVEIPLQNESLDVFIDKGANEICRFTLSNIWQSESVYVPVLKIPSDTTVGATASVEGGSHGFPAF